MYWQSKKKRLFVIQYKIFNVIEINKDFPFIIQTFLLLSTKFANRPLNNTCNLGIFINLNLTIWLIFNLMINEIKTKPAHDYFDELQYRFNLFKGRTNTVLVTKYAFKLKFSLLWAIEAIFVGFVFFFLFTWGDKSNECLSVSLFTSVIYVWFD